MSEMAYQQLAARYAEQINTRLDAEIEAWPAEVRALDPGRENTEARMRWVDSARDLARNVAALIPKAPDTEMGARDSEHGGAAPSKAEQSPRPYRFEAGNEVAW